VWFLFIFPGSGALHMPFTESVFLALAIGSFLTARKDRWALAGLLGALACLTRINGLVLMPALAVEAGYQYWKTRRWLWQWLWIGFIGFGILGYLLLNYHVFSNPFMFMTFRREHFFQVMSWPWVGTKDLVLAMRQSGEAGVIRGAQDLVVVALGLAGLSGGFGCNGGTRVPLVRSKPRMVSIVALDAYKRRACASIPTSSNAWNVPHSSPCHVPKKLPLGSNICIRLLAESAPYS